MSPQKRQRPSTRARARSARSRDETVHPFRRAKQSLAVALGCSGNDAQRIIFWANEVVATSLGADVLNRSFSDDSGTIKVIPHFRALAELHDEVERAQVQSDLSAYLRGEYPLVTAVTFTYHRGEDDVERIDVRVTPKTLVHS